MELLHKEIENCFPMIKKQFTRKSLSEFKNTHIFDLWRYHCGLGIWIRNNLLYSKESLLYNLFLDNDIEYIDEMSSFIIKMFYDSLL